MLTDRLAAEDAELRGGEPKLHLRRIDTLRAVAIVAVFLLHWYGQAYRTDHLQWNGLVLDPSSAPAPSFWLFFPLSFGWAGVPLFFVISGFCIHLSTLKRGQLQVGNFFWRRFWRIYPPYVVALLISAVLLGVDLWSRAAQGQLWSHLLHIHNFWPQWIFGVNPVFWSIAVEVQLYLLYPLLWKMRARWGIEGALKFTLALSIASRLAAAFFFTDFYKDLSGVVWTFPTMLWFDWTLGAFLAERYVNGRVAFPSAVSLRWIVGLAVIVSTFFKPTVIFTFSLTSVFFALAVESYLRRPKPLSMMERWLIPLGLCSYSFYLLHYPLIPYISRQLQRSSALENPGLLVAAAPIGVIVVALVSYVCYRTIERGSIALGNLLQRRLRSPAATR